MNYKIEIAELLKNDLSDFETEELEGMIEIPPNTEMGDYAFPCFKLAKKFRKSPNDIAKELSEKLSPSGAVEKIASLGGYVNFFIDKSSWAASLIRRVLMEKEDFGRSDLGKNKNTLIEFSSPNIAKPFHIGHIRTTVIGHSLYRIYDFMGFHAIALNHLGDYGTQFGKLIVAFKKWGDREVIEKDPINELLKIYVKFHQEAEEDPALEDEARTWFKKLEDGDKEAFDLWQWMRDVSLKEFARVYDLLGIRFDSFNGESFYSDKMPKVIEDMEKKGILLDSQGAKIVDLEAYDMPPALIMKKDGSTLYITRDLAAAIYRKETYDFFRNVYVVGTPQELHFRQWKKVLELMGYEWAKDCIHVQFGTVSLEDGSLSTRHGRVIFLEDVLKKAIEKTKEIIRIKNPDLENIDEVSKQVGIGAIVYQELSNSRIKDYRFSWDRTLSFEGETGPYIQYAHARCCSLLERSGIVLDDRIDFDRIANNKDAMEIVRILTSFDDVLMRSYQKNEPHHIAGFAFELAQAFNKFYHDNHILTESEEVQKAYLSVVESVKIGLHNSLYLLGIGSPRKM
ncbi:MAG: arginine--tRNA ligase [Peptostreptococcaceae bacterium]|nr:arginine--tRNA ligase [Peptostreptococcaceae bacterium]